MPIIRSVSGLRATLGDGLLPALLSDYAAAFSMFCPEGPVVVGRDGRPSGTWIQDIVIGTLSACGREVIKAGIVPTPTVQLVTEHSGAAGGIAITASHNPGQWNGLKFLNSEGVFLDADENRLLWDFLDKRNFIFPGTPVPGKISETDAGPLHIDKVMAISYLAAGLKNKLKEMKPKVVVDAVNASGSVIVPQLLEKLGCEVVPLYCDGSGIFPHMPEPLPANLTALATAVKEHNADMGIAVDPDADRLVLIDNEGIPVNEEKTIVLSSLPVIESAPAGSFFAVNHSTSMMLDKVAETKGIKVLRSPVGEINVVKKMKASGAIFGGEGSGGVILPECHCGRDSLVGIVLVLAALAGSGKALSELSASLPPLHMLKHKQDFSGDFPVLKDKLRNAFPDGEVLDDDGLKFIFPDKWVQVRSSNTEPIIRIIAEAFSEEEAKVLIETIRNKMG